MNHLKVIVLDILRVSLGTFVVFFVLEYFKTGIITNYLNFNFLLIILIVSVIVSGVLSLPSPRLKWEIYVGLALATGAVIVVVSNLLPVGPIYTFLAYSSAFSFILIFILFYQHD